MVEYFDVVRTKLGVLGYHLKNILFSFYNSMSTDLKLL